MFRIKLTCSAEVFTIFCCNNHRPRELLGEEQSQGMKSKHNKGLCYEEAMREAFSEIFQNLREIENNNEKKFKLRQKVDFERRRGSAPALSPLKDEKTFFRQPAIRRGSAPVLLKSSPTKNMTSSSPKIHLVDDAVNVIVFWRSRDQRWLWLQFRRIVKSRRRKWKAEWDTHMSQDKWRWKAERYTHRAKDRVNNS